MKIRLIAVMLVLLVSAGVSGCSEKTETVVPKEEFRITSDMIENSVVNMGDLTRLSGILEKAEKEGELTLALIGGSITYGAGARGNDTYAKRVEAWLRSTYPDSQIKVINAGLSGTDSIAGIHRLRRDVLVYEPDLVIVEFAVNDGVGDNGELRNIEHSYTALLRLHIR